MNVRPAAPDDAEALRAIYNAEVTGSTNTFDIEPRSLAQQRLWIDEHSGAYPAVVAVDVDGVIAGFGSLSTYRPRPAYATSVEDSVYVAPEKRGMGVGRLVLVDLVERATAHGFHTIVARIVGENEVSVRLHKSCGFELVGVERQIGRKFGKWLDVVVMQRLL
jgi:phosphinothricin acetyltransferase